MYMENGLPDDAKRMAIALIFEAPDPTVRIDARMFLAHIAVHEGRMDDAVEMWRNLIAEHSGSPQADEARRLIPIANDLRGANEHGFAGSARAELYFAAASMWANSTELNFGFLPREEAAQVWYEQITDEFPGTRDAERAIRSQAATLLRGVAGLLNNSDRSVEEQQRYNRLLDALRRTMGKFQQKFPRSPYLARMQYLVANMFFNVRRKVEAEPWLREIREREGRLTFWKQIAQLRDRHWSGR